MCVDQDQWWLLRDSSLKNENCVIIYSLALLTQVISNMNEFFFSFVEHILREKILKNAGN